MKKNGVSGGGKRLGLVLATVHKGSSLRVWESIADRAAAEGCPLFVFPGGKLDGQDGSDFLRNQVYSLVNPHNIDGLISWASSIGGAVSVPELTEFHRRFAQIPFVTMGQKIEGHPLVEFDAYAGMKRLVEHFVHHHAVRRIAFVRGPASHASAEARFRAYCDAIRENDPDGVDRRLVSSCCQWFEAEKAAAELFEERSLVPGRDFDALIAASDLMAGVVMEYLAKRGFVAPRDYLAGGFNDSVESRVAQPQLSTVRMPQTELGSESFGMLRRLLSGGSPQDKFLTAFPVIRDSCGCNGINHWTYSGELRGKIRTRAQLRDELCRIFRLGADSEAARGKIDPLLSLLFDNSRAEFMSFLSEVLDSYFEREGELSCLFDALDALRCASCIPEDYSARVARSASVLIPLVQGRVVARKRSRSLRVNAEMSALKTALLSVHNVPELLRILRDHLPRLGLRVCSLVLYDDEGLSRYAGGFVAEDGVVPGGTPQVRPETRFDENLIVPEQYAADFERGVFVVQPLFLENHPYGYIVTDRSDVDGSVYEDLRGSVSNALQNIFLFRELEAAKIAAEQAEFEKTEFFAAVGSELCDPLKNLSAKVSQMEGNVNAGLADPDILGEQLLFLRSQIEAQLEKTETLVDLTRSQVDDLPMDKRLFDVRQILPASVSASISADLPLLFGDTARLKKAMDGVFGESGGARNPSVEPRVDGLHVRFDGARMDWDRPELQLAEKIILLQYGEISRSLNGTVDVAFPWPNLGGLPPAKVAQGEPVVRALSAEGGDAFGAEVLPVTNDIFDGVYEGERTVFLWTPDDAPIDEWVKVFSLRRSDRLFRVPVICRSRMLIGHSFMEMLEEKVKSQKDASVLFVGSSRTRFGTWATDSNSVSIASMAEFDRILAEITPSLIVFDAIDEEAIVRVRRHHRTVLVPILVLPESVLDAAAVESLCTHPRVVLCNRGAAESEQFDRRVREILAGDEILPPNTGALVKKAILYLNQNASAQVVRWKLADTVHVSEDYLTRIFHREIGLSLWEYLNRYRICVATKLLLETNDSIYEIAERSGFQDQAYFCRVFKKIFGVSPGKIRTKS